MAIEDKEQKQYRAILESLLKEPANKICADCHTAGSTIPLALPALSPLSLPSNCFGIF